MGHHLSIGGTGVRLFAAAVALAVVASVAPVGAQEPTATTVPAEPPAPETPAPGPDPALEPNVIEMGDDAHAAPGSTGTEPPSAGTEYVLQGDSWTDPDLTYGFMNWAGSPLSIAEIRTAVGEAVAMWESESGLTFTRIADCGGSFNAASCFTPDIRMWFHGAGSGPDNGLAFGFDGAGGSRGHAFYPPASPSASSAAGDVHFDSAETWRDNQSNVPDLRTIAAHELGHALGLEHVPASQCYSAGKPQNASLYPVMCATIFGFPSSLHTNDINGIRALYGPPGPGEPPGLPDNEVGLEIVGPLGAPSQPSGADYKVRILNGLQTSITNAAVDVGLVPGSADHCDDAAVGTVPARDIVEMTCTLSTDGLLPAQGKSVPLGALSAALTATGTPSVAADPLTLDVVPPDAPQSDIPTWVKPATDWIVHWGIADGYPNNTYRPDNPITRAQVVRMLYRLKGEPDVTGLPAHGFTDVPPWVEDAVRWAAHDDGTAAPLVEGFSDNAFRPDDPISRGQVVRMLYRYAGAPDVTGFPGHGFTDVAAWVEDAVRWAAHDTDDAGPLEPITTGYDDNTFRVNRSITRAQVTRMIYRLCSLLLP